MNTSTTVRAFADDLMEQVIGRVGLLALVRDGEPAHERITLIHRRGPDGRPAPTTRCAGVPLAHRSASGPSKVPSVVTYDQIEELSERDAGLQLMTEVGSADHLIPVAATHLLLAQVPLPHQIAHDLLHRPLGDPDRIRDITHPRVRVQCQRDQHVPMIGQEHPLPLTHRKHTTRVPDRRRCCGLSRCRPLWPRPRTLLPAPGTLDGVIEGRATGRELGARPTERRSSHEQH